MSKEIRVESSTQLIEIKKPGIVNVVKAGPVGPSGPEGPEGPVGPRGLAGVIPGTTPPEDTSVLWYDTN